MPDFCVETQGTLIMWLIYHLYVVFRVWPETLVYFSDLSACSPVTAMTSADADNLNFVLFFMIWMQIIRIHLVFLTIQIGFPSTRVLWDVMLCQWTGSSSCIEGVQCFHLQGLTVKEDEGTMTLQTVCNLSPNDRWSHPETSAALL